MASTASRGADRQQFPHRVHLLRALFGGLKYGGSAIQSTTGAPSEVINIVIGTIVFFIAMSTMFRVLADKLAKRGGKRHASHTDSGN